MVRPWPLRAITFYSHPPRHGLSQTRHVASAGSKSEPIPWTDCTSGFTRWVGASHSVYTVRSKTGPSVAA